MTSPRPGNFPRRQTPDTGPAWPPEEAVSGALPVPAETDVEITTEIPRIGAEVVTHNTVEVDEQSVEAPTQTTTEADGTPAEAAPGMFWPDEDQKAQVLKEELGIEVDLPESAAAEAAQAAQQRQRRTLNADEVLANPDNYTAGEIQNATDEVKARGRRQHRERLAAQRQKAELDRQAAEAKAVAERNRKNRIEGALRDLSEDSAAAWSGETSREDAIRSQIGKIFRLLPDTDVMESVLKTKPGTVLLEEAFKNTVDTSEAYAELLSFTLPEKSVTEEKEPKKGKGLLRRLRRKSQREETDEESEAEFDEGDESSVEAAGSSQTTLEEASLEEVLVDKDKWLNAVAGHQLSTSSQAARQFAFDAMMLHKLSEVRNTDANQHVIKLAKSLFGSSYGQQAYKNYKNELSHQAQAEEDHSEPIDRLIEEGEYAAGVEDPRVHNAKVELFDNQTEEALIGYFRDGTYRRMKPEARAAFEVSLAERLSRDQITGENAILRLNDDGLTAGFATREGQLAMAYRRHGFDQIDQINNTPVEELLKQGLPETTSDEVLEAYARRIGAQSS